MPLHHSSHPVSEGGGVGQGDRGRQIRKRGEDGSSRGVVEGRQSGGGQVEFVLRGDLTTEEAKLHLRGN